MKLLHLSPLRLNIAFCLFVACFIGNGNTQTEVSVSASGGGSTSGDDEVVGKDGYLCKRTKLYCEGNTENINVNFEIEIPEGFEAYFNGGYNAVLQLVINFLNSLLGSGSLPTSDENFITIVDAFGAYVHAFKDKTFSSEADVNAAIAEANKQSEIILKALGLFKENLTEAQKKAADDLTKQINEATSLSKNVTNGNESNTTTITIHSKYTLTAEQQTAVNEIEKVAGQLRLIIQGLIKSSNIKDKSKLQEIEIELEAIIKQLTDGEFSSDQEFESTLSGIVPKINAIGKEVNDIIGDLTGEDKDSATNFLKFLASLSVSFKTFGVSGIDVKVSNGTSGDGCEVLGLTCKDGQLDITAIFQFKLTESENGFFKQLNLYANAVLNFLVALKQNGNIANQASYDDAVENFKILIDLFNGKTYKTNDELQTAFDKVEKLTTKISEDVNKLNSGLNSNEQQLLANVVKETTTLITSLKNIDSQQLFNISFTLTADQKTALNTLQNGFSSLSVILKNLIDNSSIKDKTKIEKFYSDFEAVIKQLSEKTYTTEDELKVDLEKAVTEFEPIGNAVNEETKNGDLGEDEKSELQQFIKGLLSLNSSLKVIGVSGVVIKDNTNTGGSGCDDLGLKCDNNGNLDFQFTADGFTPSDSDKKYFNNFDLYSKAMIAFLSAVKTSGHIADKKSFDAIISLLLKIVAVFNGKTFENQEALQTAINEATNYQKEIDGNLNNLKTGLDEKEQELLSNVEKQQHDSEVEVEFQISFTLTDEQKAAVKTLQNGLSGLLIKLNALLSKPNLKNKEKVEQLIKELTETIESLTTTKFDTDAEFKAGLVKAGTKLESIGNEVNDELETGNLSDDEKSAFNDFIKSLFGLNSSLGVFGVSGIDVNGQNVDACKHLGLECDKDGNLVVKSTIEFPVTAADNKTFDDSTKFIKVLIDFLALVNQSGHVADQGSFDSAIKNVKNFAEVFDGKTFKTREEYDAALEEAKKIVIEITDDVNKLRPGLDTKEVDLLTELEKLSKNLQGGGGGGGGGETKIQIGFTLTSEQKTAVASLEKGIDSLFTGLTTILDNPNLKDKSGIEKLKNQLTEAIKELSGTEYKTDEDLKAALEKAVTALNSIGKSVEDEINSGDVSNDVKASLEAFIKSLKGLSTSLEVIGVSKIDIKDDSNTSDNEYCELLKLSCDKNGDLNFDVTFKIDESDSAKEYIKSEEQLLSGLFKFVGSLKKSGSVKDEAGLDLVISDFKKVLGHFEDVTILTNEDFTNLVKNVKKDQDDHLFSDLNKLQSSFTGQFGITYQLLVKLNGALSTIIDNIVSGSGSGSTEKKIEITFNLDSDDQKKAVKTVNDILVDLSVSLKSLTEGGDKATEKLENEINEIITALTKNSFASLEDLTTAFTNTVSHINSALTEIKTLEKSGTFNILLRVVLTRIRQALLRFVQPFGVFKVTGINGDDDDSKTDFNITFELTGEQKTAVNTLQEGFTNLIAKLTALLKNSNIKDKSQIEKFLNDVKENLKLLTGTKLTTNAELKAALEKVASGLGKIGGGINKEINSGDIDADEKASLQAIIDIINNFSPSLDVFGVPKIDFKDDNNTPANEYCELLKLSCDKNGDLNLDVNFKIDESDSAKEYIKSEEQLFNGLFKFVGSLKKSGIVKDEAGLDLVISDFKKVLGHFKDVTILTNEDFTNLVKNVKKDQDDLFSDLNKLQSSFTGQFGITYQLLVKLNGALSTIIDNIVSGSGSGSTEKKIEITFNLDSDDQKKAVKTVNDILVDLSVSLKSLTEGGDKAAEKLETEINAIITALTKNSFASLEDLTTAFTNTVSHINSALAEINTLEKSGTFNILLRVVLTRIRQALLRFVQPFGVFKVTGIITDDGDHGHGDGKTDFNITFQPTGKENTAIKALEEGYAKLIEKLTASLNTSNTQDKSQIEKFINDVKENLKLLTDTKLTTNAEFKAALEKAASGLGKIGSEINTVINSGSIDASLKTTLQGVIDTIKNFSPALDVFGVPGIVIKGGTSDNDKCKLLQVSCDKNGDLVIEMTIGIPDTTGAIKSLTDYIRRYLNGLFQFLANLKLSGQVKNQEAFDAVLDNFKKLVERLNGVNISSTEELTTLLNDVTKYQDDINNNSIKLESGLSAQQKLVFEVVARISALVSSAINNILQPSKNTITVNFTLSTEQKKAVDTLNDIVLQLSGFLKTLKNSGNKNTEKLEGEIGGIIDDLTKNFAVEADFKATLTSVVTRINSAITEIIRLERSTDVPVLLKVLLEVIRKTFIRFVQPFGVFGVTGIKDGPGPVTETIKIKINFTASVQVQKTISSTEKELNKFAAELKLLIESAGSQDKSEIDIIQEHFNSIVKVLTETEFKSDTELKNAYQQTVTDLNSLHKELGTVLHSGNLSDKATEHVENLWERVRILAKIYKDFGIENVVVDVDTIGLNYNATEKTVREISSINGGLTAILDIIGVLQKNQDVNNNEDFKKAFSIIETIKTLLGRQFDSEDELKADLKKSVTNFNDLTKILTDLKASGKFSGTVSSNINVLLDAVNGLKNHYGKLGIDGFDNHGGRIDIEFDLDAATKKIVEGIGNALAGFSDQFLKLITSGGVKNNQTLEKISRDIKSIQAKLFTTFKSLRDLKIALNGSLSIYKDLEADLEELINTGGSNIIVQGILNVLLGFVRTTIQLITSISASGGFDGRIDYNFTASAEDKKAIDSLSVTFSNIVKAISSVHSNDKDVLNIVDGFKEIIKSFDVSFGSKQELVDKLKGSVTSINDLSTKIVKLLTLGDISDNDRNFLDNILKYFSELNANFKIFGVSGLKRIIGGIVIHFDASAEDKRTINSINVNSKIVSDLKANWKKNSELKDNKDFKTIVEQLTLVFLSINNDFDSKADLIKELESTVLNLNSAIDLTFNLINSGTIKGSTLSLLRSILRRLVIVANNYKTLGVKGVVISTFGFIAVDFDLTTQQEKSINTINTISSETNATLENLRKSTDLANNNLFVQILDSYKLIFEAYSGNFKSLDDLKKAFEGTITSYNSITSNIQALIKSGSVKGKDLISLQLLLNSIRRIDRSYKQLEVTGKFDTAVVIGISFDATDKTKSAVNLINGNISTIADIIRNLTKNQDIKDNENFKQIVAKFELLADILGRTFTSQTDLESSLRKSVSYVNDISANLKILKDSGKFSGTILASLNAIITAITNLKTQYGVFNIDGFDGKFELGFDLGASVKAIVDGFVNSFNDISSGLQKLLSFGNLKNDSHVKKISDDINLINVILFRKFKSLDELNLALSDTVPYFNDIDIELGALIKSSGGNFILQGILNTIRFSLRAVLNALTSLHIIGSGATGGRLELNYTASFPTVQSVDSINLILLDLTKRLSSGHSDDKDILSVIKSLNATIIALETSTNSQQELENKLKTSVAQFNSIIPTIIKLLSSDDVKDNDKAFLVNLLRIIYKLDIFYKALGVTGFDVRKGILVINFEANAEDTKNIQLINIDSIKVTALLEKLNKTGGLENNKDLKEIFDQFQLVLQSFDGDFDSKAELIKGLETGVLNLNFALDFTLKLIKSGSFKGEARASLRLLFNVLLRIASSYKNLGVGGVIIPIRDSGPIDINFDVTPQENQSISVINTVVSEINATVESLKKGDLGNNDVFKKVLVSIQSFFNSVHKTFDSKDDFKKTLESSVTIIDAAIKGIEELIKSVTGKDLASLKLLLKDFKRISVSYRQLEITGRIIVTVSEEIELDYNASTKTKDAVKVINFLLSEAIKRLKIILETPELKNKKEIEEILSDIEDIIDDLTESTYSSEEDLKKKLTASVDRINVTIGFTDKLLASGTVTGVVKIFLGLVLGNLTGLNSPYLDIGVSGIHVDTDFCPCARN